MMQKNNNETAKREALRDLLQDRYSFGFDLDAHESFLGKVDEFLGKVDELISEINIEDYDDNKVEDDDFRKVAADYLSWRVSQVIGGVA